MITLTKIQAWFTVCDLLSSGWMLSARTILYYGMLGVSTVLQWSAVSLTVYCAPSHGSQSLE